MLSSGRRWERLLWGMLGAEMRRDRDSEGSSFLADAQPVRVAGRALRSGVCSLLSPQFAVASGKPPLLSGLSSALCTKWLGLFPSVKPFVPVLIDGRWLAQVCSGWSSGMRRILRQCLGSVGKRVVCGRWHGGPGTASVPIVALRGLPAWQSTALRWQSQMPGGDQ